MASFKEAQAQEREYLKRSGARWPENGDIYELRAEKDLLYTTQYSAPCSGGGYFRAAAGTRIIAWVLPDAIAAGATGVAAGFPNHIEMESVVVPESERAKPSYSSYLLSVSIRELNEDFILVGNVQSKATKSASSRGINVHFRREGIISAIAIVAMIVLAGLAAIGGPSLLNDLK